MEQHSLIQTGHSNGAVTPDEQKLLANTLFYLSQLTYETETFDRSGMDVKGPTFTATPNITINSSGKLQVTNLKAKDECSTYEYYVEAIGSNDGRKLYSNTIQLTNTAGVEGFSYVLDNNPDTIPDKIVETTKDSFTVDYSSNFTWLHIAAIDKEGNVGEVLDLRIDDKPPTFTVKLEPNGWTNGLVTIILENLKDGGVGYARTKLPNGHYTESNRPTFSVSTNGTYRFEVCDKIGNCRVENVKVDKIDTQLPVLDITPIDQNRVRLEYGDR